MSKKYKKYESKQVNDKGEQYPPTEAFRFYNGKKNPPCDQIIYDGHGRAWWFHNADNIFPLLDGDFVCREIDGTLAVCEPDVFERAYVV